MLRFVRPYNKDAVMEWLNKASSKEDVEEIDHAIFGAAIEEKLLNYKRLKVLTSLSVASLKEIRKRINEMEKNFS